MASTPMNIKLCSASRLKGRAIDQQYKKEIRASL